MHVNDFFREVRFYYVKTSYGWRLDTSVGNFRGNISDYIPFSFDHDTLHSIRRPLSGNVTITTNDEHILEMRRNIIWLKKLRGDDNDN